MRSGQNLRIELRENNYSPYQLYLTNLQTEQPRFSPCFTSGSCILAKYTCAQFWQPNIRKMLRASGGFALPMDPAGGLPSPDRLAPTPKSWLRQFLCHGKRGYGRLGLIPIEIHSKGCH